MTLPGLRKDARRRVTRTVIGVLGGTLLSACVAARPPQVPSPDIAPAYGLATPVASEIPGQEAYFTDPDLRALIDRALAHNRDLRLAVLRVEEARAAHDIQKADSWPTVGLSGEGVRNRTPADLSLTGRAATGNQFTVGAGFSSWELDFWGRVSSLRGAALETFLASEASRKAATLSLIAQVADSYYTLRVLDERLFLARETLATHAETLRIFRLRVDAGSASRLELKQVETLWQQARILAEQLEQARALQLNALTLLAGGPTEIAPRRLEASDYNSLHSVPAGLPSQLLTRRPDILAAEHQLAAAHARVDAARAAFFPRIALTGSYGTASAELDGLFQSGSQAWRFSPSLSLPIFDSGRNRHNLTLAEVRRDQAVATYEKTVQTAFRDVSDCLASGRSAEAQVAILEQSQASQAERARLTRLRYDNGATAFFEVLDAERDLLSARQQLAQGRQATLSAHICLYAALGGGAAQ